MELFQKKIGPVFLKGDSDATVFIDKMHQLESKATSPELKQEIQKQIKLASYGAIGEQNIAYELKIVVWICIYFMMFVLNMKT